jgi:hypothetical protein
VTGAGALEILRRCRRSAGDLRKVFLALYGLLLWIPAALLVLALGRASLGGSLGEEAAASFLRPVQAALGFLRDGFAAGAWASMLGVLLGWLVAAMASQSFFGLAITRMAAVELALGRRAEVSEAIRFARRHWHWSFLTPFSLLLGTVLLLVLAALVVSLGRAADWLILLVVPAALVAVLGAVVLILGFVAGGILAAPAIATEWSDAFDAIARVYGYSFTHFYRVVLYRAGAALVWLGAVATRGMRAVLVLGLFYVVLLAGLGRARTHELLDAVLLEQPKALPFPQTVAGWTVLACAAAFLTLVVARLVVFRRVLHQAIYLQLRLRIDQVPFDSIDGYRPDDSCYDPTAQGFELVEVEGELLAE